MSIPIQDRIYRSRLTLKYRTNIDGTPVPQELPLRLLVLADLTGGKPLRKPKDEKGEKYNAAHPAPPLTEDRLLPNRAIVSVRRGMNVDKIIEEMNVAFPIPTTVDPVLKLLRDRAIVIGKIKGTDTAGKPLKSSVDDIENDGHLRLTGASWFSARVHDNKPIDLSGPLEVAVEAEFLVKAPKATIVPLKGTISVPVTSASALKNVKLGALTGPDPDGNYSVAFTEAKADLAREGDTAWLPDLEVKAGAFTAKPTGDTTPVLAGKRSVLAVHEEREISLNVSFSIPLAKDAKGGFTVAPDPAKPTFQFSDSSVEVKVKVATVTLANILKPTGDQPDIALKVQRKGAIQGTLTPFDVTLVNDDDTKKIGGGDATQKMPTLSLAGTLGGAFKGGSVKDILNGKASLELKDKTAVTFNFPIQLEFTSPTIPTTSTPNRLDGTVSGATGEVHFTVSELHGRVWGKKGELQGNTGPVRPEDIVVDINFPSVPTSEFSVVLKADGLDVNLAGACEGFRGIRLKSLDSFTPDAVAESVPEIRRLQIIKDLLTQLKSDINLIPPVRESVGKVMTMAGDQLGDLRTKLGELYPSLRIAAPESVLSVTPQQLAWFDGFFPDRESAMVKSAQIKDRRKNQEIPALPLVAVNKASADQLDFHDHDTLDEFRVSDQDRLVTGLAALIINCTALTKDTQANKLGDLIDDVVTGLKGVVDQCVSFVLEDPLFHSLESNWRDVAALCKVVETDKTIIDLLDLGPGEIVDDMKEHASDIFTSELFKRLYLEEYDRYGGKPFGAMIGLYHVENSGEDIDTLTTLSEIANAAHCPFITGIQPTFFGDDIETWADLDSVADIEAHLSMPKFGKWNMLRDSGEAPYLGLTLPGYLSREPWGAKEKQLGNSILHSEVTDKSQAEVAGSYLWGNSAILFAQNLVRSFESSGWCQYVRGVKGGGLIQGMTVHTVQRHGKEETQSPVEFEIADYRELQFSKAGLIPLVHCKGSSDAAFFSAQSLKKPRDFRSEHDTQNAYLVTNLAYTFSITRIAHYVKRMMRDYIGSTADDAYIQKVLQLWLNDYITTTVNPDELTLRYYPFKAVDVTVIPKPGPLGWYKAVISILPHIQFEGMDVELRLEAASAASDPSHPFCAEVLSHARVS